MEDIISMKKNTSNKGQLGVDSIRLNGTLISELPIAERVNAASQIPLAEDTERQNQIEAVLARYPKQELPALQARIKEARDNIERITKMRSNQDAMIQDYTNKINLCRIRDKEVSLYPDEPERSEKIREWNILLANANTAAYMVFENLEPFEQQIEQCKDAILEAERVIEREREDISKMEKLSGQIIARDIELRRLGVHKDRM